MSQAASNASRANPAPNAAPPGSVAPKSDALLEFIRVAADTMRRTELTYGIMMWLTVMLFFLTAIILIDHWVWDLNKPARFMTLGAMIAWSLWWVPRRIFPPLFHRINTEHAAREIEKQNPQFKDSLISWLQLSLEGTPVPKGVVSYIGRYAGRNLQGQDAASVVDSATVVRLSAAFFGCLLCGIIYLFASPKSGFTSVARMIAPWADIAPASRVQFVDIQPGTTTVTQGSSLPLTVTVRGMHQGEGVRVQFDLSDGQVVGETIPMVPEIEGRSYKLDFGKSFGGIHQPLRYSILAGDGIAGPFDVSVQVVPLVAIDRIELQYPLYTKLKPRTFPQQGSFEAPEGTQVRLFANANQVMKKARIEFDPVLDKKTFVRARDTLEMSVEPQSISASWTALLDEQGRNPTNTSYRIKATNELNETNPDPIVYQLKIIGDLAPEVFLESGLPAVLEVPVNRPREIELRARDPDYGLRELIALGTQSKSVDESKKTERFRHVCFESEEGDTGQITEVFLLDPKSLGLKPGEEIDFTAIAIDNKHDPKTQQLRPNQSSTQTLRIRVTEAEALGDSEDEQIAAGEANRSDATGNQANNQNGDSDTNNSVASNPNPSKKGNQAANNAKQSNDIEGNNKNNKSNNSKEQPSDPNNSDQGDNGGGQQDSIQQPQTNPAIRQNRNPSNSSKSPQDKNEKNQPKEGQNSDSSRGQGQGGGEGQEGGASEKSQASSENSGQKGNKQSGNSQSKSNGQGQGSDQGSESSDSSSGNQGANDTDSSSDASQQDATNSKSSGSKNANPKSSNAQNSNAQDPDADDAGSQGANPEGANKSNDPQNSRNSSGANQSPRSNSSSSQGPSGANSEGDTSSNNKNSSNRSPSKGGSNSNRKNNTNRTDTPNTAPSHDGEAFERIEEFKEQQEKQNPSDPGNPSNANDKSDSRENDLKSEREPSSATSRKEGGSSETSSKQNDNRNSRDPSSSSASNDTAQPNSKENGANKQNSTEAQNPETNSKASQETPAGGNKGGENNPSPNRNGKPTPDDAREPQGPKSATGKQKPGDQSPTGPQSNNPQSNNPQSMNEESSKDPSQKPSDANASSGDKSQPKGTQTGSESDPSTPSTSDKNEGSNPETVDDGKGKQPQKNPGEKEQPGKESSDESSHAENSGQDEKNGSNSSSQKSNKGSEGPQKQENGQSQTGNPNNQESSSKQGENSKSNNGNPKQEPSSGNKASNEGSSNDASSPSQSNDSQNPSDKANKSAEGNPGQSSPSVKNDAGNSKEEASSSSPKSTGDSSQTEKPSKSGTDSKQPGQSPSNAGQEGNSGAANGSEKPSPTDASKGGQPNKKPEGRTDPTSRPETIPPQAKEQGNSKNPLNGQDSNGGGGQQGKPSNGKPSNTPSQVAGSGLNQSGSTPPQGAAGEAGKSQGKEFGAEKANIEYADKTTNLLLDYIDRQKDQPDPELLKRLQWSADDLRKFSDRWRAAKEQARQTPEKQAELEASLRSLGLRRTKDSADRLTDRNDNLRGMQEQGGRLRPPESLREQFEAFRKAAGKLDKSP